MKFSANSAAKELGITKTTMLKWILQDKVRARQRKIGDKTYWEIDEKEMKRLQRSLVKKRKKGFPIMEEKS